MVERILLTGATGYIGSRLLPRLEAAGFYIRCLARRPQYLANRKSERVEVVQGDVLDPESLIPAMQGMQAAYYLVHSLGTSHDFQTADRTAARNFAEAARHCGLRRIIYLGGLGEQDPKLSPHLQSRQEVGKILAGSGVPVVEFRASIVIGAGSLSFELIRALVERLPVMIIPRWVRVQAQPIALADVLDYLQRALTLEVEGHRIIEIGGRDRVSYADLMREYARQRGFLRLMIPVPVLTPRLSSLWLGLVTPVYARVGRKLVDGVRNPTVVRDDSAQRLFDLRPRDFREAIAQALDDETREMAQTRWSDALSATGAERHWGGTRFGNRLIDQRRAEVEVSCPEAFKPIRRIGGQTGWYYADWLWQIRGYLDLLVGGVGMRRGRRHIDRIGVGDVIDCWRVEVFEPNRRLRLEAEMKLPGRAWLEFEVEPKDHGALITQTAMFDPIGLFGLAYWYLVWPIHRLVFKGMLRGILRQIDRDKSHKPE